MIFCGIAFAIMLLFFDMCEKIYNWIGINETYDKNAPTEIFKIKEVKNEKEDGYVHYIEQFFVIYNPPKNKSLLKKTVEKYCFETMSVDTIKKYDRYEQIFYRETECLTRNYEEDKPYPELPLCGVYKYKGDNLGQHISKHRLLVRAKFTNIHEYGDYYYNYWYKDSKHKEFYFNNIDSFYVEYRRNLNK
jgi:hypothetical protein